MAQANGTGANPPAILKKSGTTTAPNTSKSSRRTAQPRLKIVVRRLPPGLTQAEFETLLGSEWAVGKGKVDWADYHPGKVSKEQGKPSRPATAYLHLTDSAHVATLADYVRDVQFVDGKTSYRDPVLIGPPVVEFAPNPKVPQNRNRKDPRQGTIDQDPEFIAFLESLTNPIQKPNVDLEASLQKEDKVTTTPLIEHLREKKAAKERPSKSSKESREQRKRRKKEAAATSSEKTSRQSKGEQSAKDGVKVLSRQASTTSNTEGEKNEPSSSATATEKRRERGPLNIAAKIQRDLGIGPGASRRASRTQKGADSEASASTSSVSAKDSANTGQTPANISSSRSEGRKEGRGRDRRQKAESSKTENATDAKPATLPVILKKQPDASSGTAASSAVAPQSSNTTTQSSSSAPTGSAARRVFLKHANPSQGITEQLLEAALSRFGTVVKVEIDRKKGTAWAEFEDQASLATAIKAGKVEVANGAVQVSNFRERPPQSGGGRGGSSKAAAQSGQTPQQSASNSTGSGRSRGTRGGRGRARGGGGGGTDGSSSAVKDSASASASKS